MMARRTLAGAAMALLGAPAAMATAANPDAELIRLCAEYHSHDAAAHVDYPGDNEKPDGESVWEYWLDRRNEVQDQLEEMEPQTVEGLTAMAGVARAQYVQSCPCWEGSDFERFAVIVLGHAAGRQA